MSDLVDNFWQITGRSSRPHRGAGGGAAADAGLSRLSLRRSTNVGPLTNNPTREAALLNRMMEATDAALAPEKDK